MNQEIVAKIVSNVVPEHYEEIGAQASGILVDNAMQGRDFEEAIAPRGRGGAPLDLLTSMQVVYYTAATIKIIVELKQSLSKSGDLKRLEMEVRMAFDKIAAKWPTVSKIVRKSLPAIVERVAKTPDS